MSVPHPTAAAPRDWFFWVVAAYTGLQVLWAAVVAVDFGLHPWAPGLDDLTPMGRLLTVLVGVPLNVGIALLVLRRTRGNIVGLCLLLWGTSIMGSTLRPDSALVAYNALNTGWVGLWLLPLFFPDGRPQPRRLAGLIRGLSTLLVVGQPIGVLFQPDQRSGGRADLANGLYVAALDGLRPVMGGLFAVALGATLLLIVPSLVARYRWSDERTRQQMKWLAWAVGLILAIFPVTNLFGLMSNVPVELSPPLQLVEDVLGMAIVAAPALSVGQAILRHRLYDIDFIIRRTLVYSVLSAVLGLAYLGSVLVLQGVFQAVTGEAQGELVTVLSTLAIAALFGPVRRQVQAAIDRRFYRKKYDAARTLAGFGAQARDVVELEQLSGKLLGVVEETMQPAHASLWLRSLPAVARTHDSGTYTEAHA